MVIGLFQEGDRASGLGSEKGRRIRRRSVDPDRVRFEWRNWTPVYGATEAMTYTDVQTTYARYLVLDQLCFFGVSAEGTTGGTASSALTFTLPVRPLRKKFVLSCLVGDSTDVGGFAFIDEVGERLAKCSRYDAVNFGLGASRTINVSGFYEIAD